MKKAVKCSVVLDHVDIYITSVMLSISFNDERNYR